ncbi:hypothetical protein ANCDUO_22392 [Ancylostoma duodenale]|uniref:Uncharacterized protein n=1 Tax=Ancylostoma duodenale TaxID=51022 RepID=A0A0C2FL99_9BILA|nr:hypothetical protein ANCDUO_22392 [Ancylostoma duodenale]
MADPMFLRSQKALLTRYCNNLSRLLDKGEKELHPIGTEFSANNETQALLHEIDSTSQLILDTLSAFIATCDSLIDTLDEEQQKQVQQYIDSTHAVLDRAHCFAIHRDAALRSAREQMHAPSGTIPIAPTNGIGGAVQMTQPKLPAIPIPNFSGKKKYGDNTKLIASLQTRFENARAERSTIQGQRRLLKYIIPIITQLGKLSINLDGSYLAQKILAKFTPAIQRQVLACRLPKSTNDSDWRMQDIINTLDDLITTEERIQEMVDKTVHHDTHSNLRDPPPPRLTHKIPLCMFCRSDKHKSSLCTQYSTISAQRIFMQERNLCLNDDADKENKRRKQNEDEQRTTSRNADYIESVDSLEIEEGEEIEPEEMLFMVDESGEDDDPAEEGEI